MTIIGIALIVVGAIVSVFGAITSGHIIDQLNRILISKGIPLEAEAHYWRCDIMHRRLLREHAPDLAIKYSHRVAIALLGMIVVWAGIIMLDWKDFIKNYIE
jgi:hypothetical protein